MLKHRGNVLGSEPDAMLVAAARAGDKSAFVQIVARHQALVCSAAFGILNDFAASEDAAQEAFLTAWQKIADLREPRNLRAWLAQIARNAALAQLRRRRGEEVIPPEFDLVDEARRPDEHAVSDEESALVRAALERVPELYRSALVLYYQEGHSVQAVAEVLGVGEDAVKQRLARGREMLRQRVEGVIETVLKRKGPTAAFTISVAAAIGALAAPGAIAAGAFASHAGGLAAGAFGPAASLLSTMSASKSLLGAAALVAVLSIPIGYQWSAARTEGRASMPSREPVVQTAAEPRAGPSFQSSVLFAEWRALHERYGSGAEAMPLIHQAVQEMTDPLRRSAFTSAVIAEWAQISPESALAFFSVKGRDSRQCEQFFHEWFTLDPRSAVTKAPTVEPWGEWVRRALPDLARREPDLLPVAAARLPKNEDFYDTSISEAFAIVADRDPLAVRKLAESFEGPNRGEALAGVARSWARTDLDGAIAWAKGLPPDASRDEVVRAALISVAAVDPMAALDRLGVVPPGGRSAYGESTTGARVLRAASDADFETTVSWLAANPGRVSHEDLRGLSNAVTERLNSDPASFLSMLSDRGALGSLLPAVESALLNRSSGLREVVWDWVTQQAPSDNVRALRTGVLDSAAWQNPDLALRLVKDLPADAGGDAEVDEVARALMNGGQEMQRFEKLYANAPDRLRVPLVRSAFRELSGENLESPQTWLGRAALLPEGDRGGALGQVARAWAQQSPEDAASWAETLPTGDSRAQSLEKVAAAWKNRDASAALDWVNSLPEPDRAAARAGLQAKKGK